MENRRNKGEKLAGERRQHDAAEGAGSASGGATPPD